MISRQVALSAILGVCALLSTTPMLADDSAASIAAGGLVPRRETRIVMAKEVLQISPTRVIVDYDFRNDSDQDVTTEVAFPIPPYENDWTEQDPGTQSFDDFHLWINNVPVKYQAEAKATLKGKDVTKILAADKIDVATFGHFQDVVGTDHVSRNQLNDIERLPKAEQRRLESAGLIDLDPDYPFANWTVHLQYHWTQTFPAHSSVHIRHEYSPVEGFQYLNLGAIKKALANSTNERTKTLRSGRPQDDYDLLMSFCPDRPFLRGAVHSIEQEPDSGPYASPQWVDFILTSANTWKQPIEDFTLILERGRPLDGYSKPMPDRRRVISFCSPENAPVKRIDADHFQVNLTNFIPIAELHIGFFDFDAPKAETKSLSAK